MEVCWIVTLLKVVVDSFILTRVDDVICTNNNQYKFATPLEITGHVYALQGSSKAKIFLFITLINLPMHATALTIRSVL